jgi:hypothetical protein
METNPESSRIVIRKRGKSRQESWSGSAAQNIGSLLTHYSERMIGALNGLQILDVGLPTAPFDALDPSQRFNVSNVGAPDIRVTVTSNPVTFPFRLSGVVWLIDRDHIAIIGKYLPNDAVAPSAPSRATPGFDAVRRAYLSQLKEGLGIETLPMGVWVAASKDFIADALNQSFLQASP